MDNSHAAVRGRLIRAYTKIERDLAQLVRDAEWYISNRTDQDCSAIAGDLEVWRVNLAGARRALKTVTDDVGPIDAATIRMLEQEP